MAARAVPLTVYRGQTISEQFFGHSHPLHISLAYRGVRRLSNPRRRFHLRFVFAVTYQYSPRLLILPCSWLRSLAAHATTRVLVSATILPQSDLSASQCPVLALLFLSALAVPHEQRSQQPTFVDDHAPPNLQPHDHVLSHHFLPRSFVISNRCSPFCISHGSLQPHSFIDSPSLCLYHAITTTQTPLSIFALSRSSMLERRAHALALLSRWSLLSRARQTPQIAIRHSELRRLAARRSARGDEDNA